ncbi:MAG: hypothetical protein ABIY50_01325 [Ignavibacteria bacterium]
MQNYLENTNLDITIDRFEQQDRESHTTDSNFNVKDSGTPWYFGFNYNDVYFDEIFWDGLDIEEQFKKCIKEIMNR